MTEEYIQMNHVLGISDKRAEEIAREVLDALTGTGRFDAGTKKLMETYDPEALLVGLRLFQVINLQEKQRTNPKEVQAFRRAFGEQNAEQN